MAVLGEIEHTTTYRYAKPVTFGTHRAMFMPRRGASARLQVFLPGAGWLDYDPTNQINCGFELIPVAVARHPGQAIPLEGVVVRRRQGLSGHVGQRRRPQARRCL